MARDPDVIVDREEELDHLHRLLERGRPQLVLMFGRRRVGKTHLLARAWKGPSSFYFTASETTPAQNRDALLSTFSEWSGEPVHAEDYPTWRTVFKLLLDHAPQEPLVITLDEFQYLGGSAGELKAVASELNAAWEARRPARPLVFVIAGSAVRLLEGLNEGGSPLYGRFGWQCRLRPFNYWHAAELAGLKGLRDRAYVYGLFGGTPRYLAAIDPDRTVAENAHALLLKPGGEVRELLQTALIQEQGLRDIPKYVAILRPASRPRVGPLGRTGPEPQAAGGRHRVRPHGRPCSDGCIEMASEEGGCGRAPGPPRPDRPPRRVRCALGTRGPKGVFSPPLCCIRRFHGSVPGCGQGITGRGASLDSGRPVRRWRVATWPAGVGLWSPRFPDRVSLRLGSNPLYPEGVGVSLRWVRLGFHPHRKR
jgi:hypothetical protein